LKKRNFSSTERLRVGEQVREWLLYLGIKIKNYFVLPSIFSNFAHSKQSSQRMRNLSDAELAQLLDKDIFHQISDVADHLGLECYVVGGYVRDLFLERPSNDIDVVVVGSGISIAEELKRQLGRKAHLSVFRNFGTAQVKIKGENGEIEVEFVGARRESYSHDSRKPIVEDGTLQDDQNRRDFTINAMAVCLNKERFGELVDPFDGLYDLEDGIIRTPLDPDITFSDDPLRMMRCVRFATQLRFFIDDETFEALERNAERIKIISGERIQEELNKILMAQQPSRGFVDLYRCGLLQIIMPELCALDVVETRNGKAHKNNFYHTLEVLDNVAKNGASLWLRWAALLHDIGKPRSKRWEPLQGWTFHNHNYIGAKMVPDMFRRLKLPMDMKMKYVQKMVDLHMRPIVIADEEVTDSAVRRLMNDAGDDIDDLMMLCEADITSKNQVRKAKFLDNFRIVREKLADLKVRDYKRLLQPVIDGNEIMEMFHLSPCREVGVLKQALKDAVLDNQVPNEREPLMQLLMEKAQEMGLHA
jgi:putative nucleotidyltransferase with HDIG domain